MEPGWTWIRESPASWQLTTSELRIELDYGDLWSTFTNNCRNLLIRPAPSTDFTIEAHLVADLVANVNQALIVVYENDDSYLRLGLLNGGGVLYVNHVHEIGGVPQPQSWDYGVADVHLRLSVAGAGAMMWFSPDGVEWTQHASVPDLSFAPVYVGLVAFDGFRAGQFLRMLL